MNIHEDLSKSLLEPLAFKSWLYTAYDIRGAYIARLKKQDWSYDTVDSPWEHNKHRFQMYNFWGKPHILHIETTMY